MKSSGTSAMKVAFILALAIMLSPVAIAKPKVESLHQQPKDFSDSAALSSEMQANGHRWVKARILIKAAPHLVWETVHEERKHDPDLAYSKILSQDKTHATLEQKFSLIPIIGSAVCVMHNSEVPFERIDYHMISSDRFKAMEGSWVLSPGKDANSTYLELSSYCDIGLPIPRYMIDGVTGKKLQKRLSNVKNMAEVLQLQVAHTAKLN